MPLHTRTLVLGFLGLSALGSLLWMSRRGPSTSERVELQDLRGSTDTDGAVLDGGSISSDREDLVKESSPSQTMAALSQTTSDPELPPWEIEDWQGPYIDKYKGRTVNQLKDSYSGLSAVARLMQKDIADVYIDEGRCIILPSGVDPEEHQIPHPKTWLPLLRFRKSSRTDDGGFITRWVYIEQTDHLELFHVHRECAFLAVEIKKMGDHVLLDDRGKLRRD